MKLALFLFAGCVVLGLSMAIENRTTHKLINRPKFDVFGQRQKRTPYEGVKGGVRVHPLFQFTTKPPKLVVRKGEYICGDKVCQLQPGEIPKGCKGTCQYRIL